MKKIIILVAVLSIVIFTVSPECSAQQGMKRSSDGGWGTGAGYSKMYDPNKVETIGGEVISVNRVKSRRGPSQGVHLMLKSDKELVSVHLGPEWFIGKQDIKIEPKDKIEVTGSRVIIAGKPAIIASEVKKGDQVLKLRDIKTGYPAWSGSQRP